MHGDFSQSQRNYSVRAFTNNTVKFLVATDVAARGLDIKVNIYLDYDGLTCDRTLTLSSTLTCQPRSTITYTESAEPEEPEDRETLSLTSTTK